VRILLDTCVWGGVRADLAAAGHDVVWTGDWAVDPGDDEIMSFAVRERRILITLDKDFGELVVARGLPHGGIVRLVGVSARRQGTVALHVLEGHVSELAAGALITVEPGRVRIRV
jgi:predicted nuclease of predicted toxin-antitoxin system